MTKWVYYQGHQYPTCDSCGVITSSCYSRQHIRECLCFHCYSRKIDEAEQYMTWLAKQKEKTHGL